MGTALQARVQFHLFQWLKHMEITMQYLNKDSGSGGFHSQKYTAATIARYLALGAGKYSTQRAKLRRHHSSSNYL